MTTSANNPAANNPSGNPAQASASLTAFKAYDIRGQLGSEMTEDIAYRIARAYAQHIGADSGAKSVVLGGDIRATSAMLKAALARGLMDSGCNVIDLGMTGTEEIYHAAFTLDVDGGIEVTASHNPMDYNGMKMVRAGSAPVRRRGRLRTRRRHPGGCLFLRPGLNAHASEQASKLGRSVLRPACLAQITVRGCSKLADPWGLA